MSISTRKGGDAPPEKSVVSAVLTMMAESDTEDAARRAACRKGGNMYNGKQWNIFIPARRSAITANVTKALIDHVIAVMTKQDPIPVVEPDDAGDVISSQLMRSLLQQTWREQKMRQKSRRVLKLAKTTMTAGAKVRWDPTLKGGAGDIAIDVVPGWRLILDPRNPIVENMRYIGDRSVITRDEALLRYGHTEALQDEIINGGEISNNIFTGGSAASPLASPFKSTALVDSPTNNAGTIINGKPVMSAQTARPTAADKDNNKVEIVEMYFRDRSLWKKKVTVNDHEGKPIMQIAKDKKTGEPLFEETDEIDEILEMKADKLVYVPVQREEIVPKYPHYRRVTLLMPDQTKIADTAWDGPAPYEIYSDAEPLEGSYVKGCTAELEDLQAVLNVSLSTMMDNLRFSSYRAFKASNSAQLERNNLVLTPGQIVHVQGDVNALQLIEFPQLSESWFNWLNNIISLMERIVGAPGIMQGNAKDAPRTDSGAGFDALAEIGGSTIVEATQRFETFIAGLMKICGWFAQNKYTERHAIKVEDNTGTLSWERASAAQLMGTFSYNIAVGSTMAWNTSGVRARLLEDMAQGLRDKISVWKHPAMGIEDWQQIKTRIATQPPQLNPPPPVRTRQTSGTSKGKKAPPGHG